MERLHTPPVNGIKASRPFGVRYRETRRLEYGQVL
jgi:hypothetical protein